MDEIAAEQAKQKQLDASTISFVQPGDPQVEKSWNQQGEETTVDRLTGRIGRRAKKWFSYDLPIEAAR